MMAASRVALSTRRLCHRYQLFFFIVFFLVLMQAFLGYNFYTISQSGQNQIQSVERRVDDLERVHQGPVDQPTDEEFMKGATDSQKQNGQGAAEGPNNVKHLSDLSKKAPALNESWGQKDPRGRSQNLKDLSENLQVEVQYYPSCDILAKDALSSILRARTQKCKQDIADIACMSQAGKLYERRLPRYCPLKDAGEGEYLGCFKDSTKERLLNGYHIEFREDNTPERCLYFCLRAGFQYGGAQFSYECWCGDHVARDKRITESRCDSACSGNNTLNCGGYLTLNVYRTGLGSKPYGRAVYIKPEDLLPSEVPVRVVFVLTVNGRAFRQVKRLLKALYHSNHYFYIHVDARQEYLYREVKAVAERFPNMRMAPHRLSTIWGGASLLTMLLQCMKDLINMTDWNWDFFVNLSESDYPVKPFEDLAAFLSRYKGKNFVKSHGRDTARFIRKQGLDKTFYECDTHMWRLGNRYLPNGIRIDGGSDWIGLSYEFSKYLIQSTDPLLTGLLKYYKYSLLPAESFFHTMLQNSKYCTTMVNNNLHLTNWRRKQGCKCQYKHIVDWCGCSPNDFLPTDLEKLMPKRSSSSPPGNEDRPVYFARKFEAIINQEVINELDAYLYGSYAEDTLGLSSYWQSDYSRKDVNTAVDDAHMTFYETFAALSSLQVKSLLTAPRCTFTPTKVLEATLYSFSDQLQGLLIHYSAKTLGRDTPEREVETLVQPKKMYKLVRPAGPVSRIKNLEVGIGFDPKEELFRDFAGLIGPYSDISLAHSWGSGHQFSATVVWVDPAGTVAGSYDIIIKAEESVSNFKPTLQKPLRPGIWTVKLLYLWEVSVETQFLVTPLLVYGGRTITDAEAVALHNGPTAGMYSERSYKDIKTFLQLQDSEMMEKLAVENGKKVGSELRSWVSTLVQQAWHVSDSCVNGAVLKRCPRLQSCQKTSWSSLSPDPKSDIGEIKENGRIR